MQRRPFCPSQEVWRAFTAPTSSSTPGNREVVCINALTVTAQAPHAAAPRLQEPWVRRLTALRTQFKKAGWDTSLFRPGPGRCCRCGAAEVGGDAASGGGGAAGGLAAKKLKFCSGCMAAKYCGEGCIKADWPSHKPVCKAVNL